MEFADVFVSFAFVFIQLHCVIRSMGYAGRQCIFRALCESSQYFGRQKSNLAVEMVKTIFR